MGQSNLNYKSKLMRLDIQKFGASLSLSLGQNRQDIGGNYSNVTLTITATRTSGITYWNDARPGTAYIDGRAHTFYLSLPQGVPSNSTSITVDVGHNSDGTKTVGYSASIATGTSAGTISSSGETTLSRIPRHANITSFSVSKISGIDGLTKVKYNWSADANCDWAWYSIDNGSSWHNLPNSGIVGGLEPGKGYNFKLRVRRTDSQLTTDSWTVYQETHKINQLTSDFTTISNGSELKVTASSPSGAKCNIKIEIPNTEHAIIHENTIDTTFTIEEINSFLQYVTGTSSTNFRISALTLDNNNNVLYTHSKNGTYQIVNSNPIFNDFSFKDINGLTTNLTGNNQDCIIGYSHIKALIPVENKAIAQNYAAMYKYRYTTGTNQTQDFEYDENSTVEMLITHNQQVGGIPVGANSGTFTIYAIDSRGLSTSVQKQANNIITYKDLQKTDTGIAQRVDDDGHVIGVSEKTQISFTGNIWNGDFGVVENSIKSVSYRFKQITSDEWITGETPIIPTIDENGKFSFKGIIKGDTDLGFDISNVYTIEVIVTDELSQVIYTINLGSGKPHVAYARDGVAIMGKYDEEVGGKGQVAGNPLAYYPIGSIYMSTNATSPAELFGGKWEAIESRFLLAASSEYKAGSTGGEKEHTLTQQEIPGMVTVRKNATSGWGNNNWTDITGWGNYQNNSTGEEVNKPHNNMPPYLVVYMWQRIK